MFLDAQKTEKKNYVIVKIEITTHALKSCLQNLKCDYPYMYLIFTVISEYFWN